jgi:hypothetical protein
VINVDDIATLARGLCGSSPNEARIRCAIGRAYYAAYHCCLSAAAKWCGPLTQDEEKGKGSHEKLYYRLQHHGKKQEMGADLRSIAEEAKKLRFHRTQADYELNIQITQNDLSRSIKHMQNVLDQFSDLESKDC